MREALSFILSLEANAIKPSACDALKLDIKKEILAYFEKSTTLTAGMSWQESFLRQYEVNEKEWRGKVNDKKFYVELVDWVAMEITEEAVNRRSLLKIDQITARVVVDCDKLITKITNGHIA
jgi:hypothetical protein